MTSKFKASIFSDVMPKSKKNDHFPMFCVYRLYRDGDVIYVGQSTCLPDRLTTHLVDFDEFDFCPCEEGEMSNLEAFFIVRHQAQLNRTLPANDLYDSKSNAEKVLNRYFRNMIAAYISKAEPVFNCNTESKTSVEYISKNHIGAAKTLIECVVRDLGDRHDT
jgi:hypothetical protein